MASTIASYREFPFLFNVYNENQSWLSAENKARLDSEEWNHPGHHKPDQHTKPAQYTSDIYGLPAGNKTVWRPQLTNFEGAGHFNGAPVFFAINGFVYANTPTFEMCLDDNVSGNLGILQRC